MSAAGYETVETDVLVLGAGGAGLRGAIAAAEAGARERIASKITAEVSPRKGILPVAIS